MQIEDSKQNKSDLRRSDSLRAVMQLKNIITEMMYQEEASENASDTENLMENIEDMKEDAVMVSCH